MRLFPEICHAAGKDLKRLRLLRTWLMAREMDSIGRGCFRVEELAAFCDGFEGLSLSSLKGILRQGDGIFWARATDGRIFLVSLDKICETFGVDKLSRPAIVDPPKTLAEFRALCCFSRCAGSRMSNPISRPVLGNQAGRAGATVTNYRRRLGERLEVQKNYSHTGIAWTGEPPEGYYVFRGELIKLLPNSYRLCVPKGKKRKGSGQPDIDRCRGKLYYQSDKDWSRRIQGRREGDVTYLSEGNGEWTRWQFVDGRLIPDGDKSTFFSITSITIPLTFHWNGDGTGSIWRNGVQVGEVF